MKTTKNIPARLLVASAVSMALSAPALWAAEADDVLSEVVVTAERREQNLQEVPISATVFSGADLDRRGVTDLNDIQTVAPSVAINVVNRSTFVNIRGVGIAQSAPTSSPGVAYYIDGQLIPHEQFIGQSFYDIGAIEVLRGPQGTLTGQNSTGGAIYVRTPAPKFSNYSGSFETSVGNFSALRSIGAVNLGFTDNVALRVAAVHDKRDSFTDNAGPSGSDPGDVGLDAVRANLAFQALDARLRANLRFEYFNWETDNNAVKNRTDTVTSDPFTIEEDGRSYMNQQGRRLSLELRYGVTDGMDVRLLSSRQRGVTEDQTDGDRTATALPQPPTANVGRVAYARTTFNTWMHEVNLVSTGNGPIKWVLGGFYLDENVPVQLLRDNRHTTDFVVSNSTIITEADNKSKSVFGQVNAFVNERLDENVPVQLLRDNRHTTDFVVSNSTIITEADNKSKSVFGQVNAFVNERLELIGGLRRSKDTQFYNRIALPGAPLPAGTDRIGPPASSTETTGRAGVNFHAADDLLYYATVSKGYKAGGVNLTLGTPNFKPETNLVYEAGIKTTILDRHLRLNASAFYSDYKDIQLSSLFNALPLTQNAASGESLGLELELTGRFGPWGVNFGAGYLDAQFAKDASIVNTLTNAQQIVVKGSDLVFSPDLTLNAGVDYEFALGSGTLTPRLQYSYVGEQLATPFPTVATTVPARGLFDLRLTYAQGDRWQVEAYATNLTDKTYIASQIQNSTSATGGIIYGAPRQIGLRAKVNFGQ